MMYRAVENVPDLPGMLPGVSPACHRIGAKGELVATGRPAVSPPGPPFDCVSLVVGQEPDATFAELVAFRVSFRLAVIEAYLEVPPRKRHGIAVHSRQQRAVRR